MTMKNQIQKIRTVGDARRKKILLDMRRFPEPKPTSFPFSTNPAIGNLTRNGKTVFYAYIAGAYTEGDVDALESALKGN
jgi:hypothetical protein